MAVEESGVAKLRADGGLTSQGACSIVIDARGFRQKAIFQQ